MKTADLPIVSAVHILKTYLSEPAPGVSGGGTPGLQGICSVIGRQYLDEIVLDDFAKFHKALAEFRVASCRTLAASVFDWCQSRPISGEP